MAGSARYTALLDANTLYPAPLRDLLLSLAVDGLYHARWTARIHDEWMRNLAKDRPELVARLPQLVALMNRIVPDCLIENYEALIDGLAAVKAMRARLRRPSQTAAELIATLERAGLPASAAHLRRAEALI